MSDSDFIKVGDYVIIQRQDYSKLHKFGSKTSTASLGREQIELANIEGCKYFTTFKMIPQGRGKNRSCILEPTNLANPHLIKDNLVIAESGADNRNITDDGNSQKLTKEQIIALRDDNLSSADIVGTLINNSNTFNSKTGYSQEKYLKKKENKYHEYVLIKKPTLRVICDIMYRQDPSKIMGIRVDTLSQVISYSNISSFGNHLLYDSGSNGLLSAALLNSIGAGTEGCLVHMHPGNSAQKQALLAMNFESEQIERCISVNLYSVLRHYYQSNGTAEIKEHVEEKNGAVKDDGSNKRKREESEDGESCKIKKTGDAENIKDGQKVPKWELENEKACVLLRKRVDSLIIACKEHPLNIFKTLMTFVSHGRPFVIFHTYQEPLQNTYIALRKNPNVVGLKLTQNWLRGYQVLPDRTHPEVMMQGNSAFILSGWIVESSN